MSGKTHPSALGKYEVRGVLGKGAMGIVYDGFDPVIHRRVAIKTLPLPDHNDEEAVEGLARFKREAQAAGRLTHPNIVGVFDYGETQDLAYIVMEFVEGRSLKEVLANNERMTAETAVQLMQDILAGLAYSHDSGVVHRDIKPANIMITNDGRTKIADFGIARIEASSMTQAGTVLGTPAYMSPEQFMGQVVDRRTDIYSSGVLLYQLLAGERPFDGSMTAIMHKSLTTVPPRPSELSVTAPPALDSVVARAMGRRPEDRYATAREFAQALRQPWDEVADPLAIEETIITPSKSPPARAPEPRPRLPEAPVAAKPRGKLPLVLGAGAALLAVAAALAWLLLPGKGAPPAAPVQTALQAAPTPQASPRETAVSPAAPVSPPPSSSRPALPAPPIQQALVPDKLPPAAPVVPPIAGAAPVTPPAVPVIPPAVVPPVAVAPPAQAPQTGGSAPPPVVAPTRSASAIQSVLGDILPNVKCTIARATVAPDRAVTVGGIVGTGDPELALRNAVSLADPASIDWQAQTIDGQFCGALDLLRPLSDPVGRDRRPLAMRLIASSPVLFDNDVIPVQVTMPDFAGYLHLVYVENDAVVGALVPGGDYKLQKYQPRVTIEFGRPHDKFEGWRVGGPFGRDMIVAIASTVPLFTAQLPDTQSLGDYLGMLQPAIADLRRRGEKAAAVVLLLDTKETR